MATILILYVVIGLLMVVLAVFVLFFGVGLAQSWRYMNTLTKSLQ